MKYVLTAVCAMLIVSSLALGADKSTTTASAPATAASAPSTATAPATNRGPAKTLAVVGGKKITSAEVDVVLSRFGTVVPEEMREAYAKQVVDMFIKQEYVRHFLAARKISVTNKELEAWKEKNLAPALAKTGMTMDQFMKAQGLTDELLRDQACLEKLLNGATSEKKVNAYVKANPKLFEGTSLKASHILLKCSPMAPTAQQKEVVAKLETIAADIQAGKTTFEAAAKKFSDCPSKEKGGDLGDFTFERMVTPFSVAAFNAPKGKVTGVVRTSFGFHIIKVTEITKGQPMPAEEAKQVAQRALQGLIEGELLAQAMTDCPIVVIDDAKPTTQPTIEPTTKAAVPATKAAAKPAK